MLISDARRLRELEAENNKLKKLLAEAHLDIHALNTAFGVTRTPVARLVDRRGPLFAGSPETCGHHQQPDGLLGQRQAVALAQLLACQRGPEVSVALLISVVALWARPGAS